MKRARWDTRYRDDARWRVDHAPLPWLVDPGELEQAFAALEIAEACECGDMSFLAARKPHK